MRAHLPGRLLLAACLLVSACTTAPVRPAADRAAYQQHLASLAPLQAFDMHGRIGVQSYKQGFSGRFDWQHLADSDRVGLYSPLGAQVVTITKTPAGVELVTSDRKVYSAPDAETLTEQNLGWRLPMRGLYDWAVGRPSPASPSQAEWDANGKLTRLKQDGWEIEYSEYRNISGYELPQKIYLKSQQLNLKLLVEQWTVAAPDAQGRLNQGDFNQATLNQQGALN